METIQLNAKIRDTKQSPRKVRSEDYIPAELYGHNVENVHLQVPRGEFEKVLRKAGESTIVDLSVEGTTYNVLIHAVQRHYLRSNILHVDFFKVNMTEKLTTNVALEYVGEADAVKLLGGTLMTLLETVEVECLPKDLPHNLEVDITPLKTFDDSVMVSSIKVPSGVTLLTDPEETVAKVQPPRNVEAELAEPVVEDVESVGKVGDDEKKEEEPAEEKAE